MMFHGCHRNLENKNKNKTKQNKKRPQRKQQKELCPSMSE